MCNNLQLSRTERLILANQYRILETIQPEEAEYFAAARQIVERGYERHYDSIAQHVYEETFSADRSGEIFEILEMFSALKHSYDKLTDKSGIDTHGIRFMGFDGNNETSELCYTEFFCNGPDGSTRRFTDIVKDEVPNSHSPSLDVYRRMLRAWKDVRNPDNLILTKDQIIQITEARIHPSNRKPKG